MESTTWNRSSIVRGFGLSEAVDDDVLVTEKNLVYLLNNRPTFFRSPGGIPLFFILLFPLFIYKRGQVKLSHV